MRCLCTASDQMSYRLLNDSNRLGESSCLLVMQSQAARSMNLYKTLEDRLKETLTPRGDTVCLDPRADKQVLPLELSTEIRVLLMSQACLLNACTHLKEPFAFRDSFGLMVKDS